MHEAYSLNGFVSVDQNNLEQYYYDWDGNLYYKDTDIMYNDGKYYPVDGFDLEDLRHGIDNGVKLLFVYGEALPPFTEEELTDI